MTWSAAGKTTWPLRSPGSTHRERSPGGRQASRARPLPVREAIRRPGVRPCGGLGGGALPPEQAYCPGPRQPRKLQLPLPSCQAWGHLPNACCEPQRRCTNGAGSTLEGWPGQQESPGIGRVSKQSPATASAPGRPVQARWHRRRRKGETRELRSGSWLCRLDCWPSLVPRGVIRQKPFARRRRNLLPARCGGLHCARTAVCQALPIARNAFPSPDHSKC